MDCLTEIYEPEWPGHDQIPVKSQALQIYYEDLCHKLNDQVTIPLSTYLSQFSEIKVRSIIVHLSLLAFFLFVCQCVYIHKHLHGTQHSTTQHKGSIINDGRQV